MTHSNADRHDDPLFDPQTPAPRPGGIAARAQAAQVSAPARYLQGLNPEQRDAVETTEGALLVLAGAGTGKTRVLTTRIAHILASRRAFPSQILAVTFTNKAAREMKVRIGALIGGEQTEGMPWLGTFHSIGVKILRRHGELVGLRSDFTILDTDDQIRLMKQVIQAAGLDDKRWPARQLANLIDGWKNRGLSPDKIPDSDAYAFGNGRGRELYTAYQERLKTLNAVDFGDLLTECVRLFREHPDVLESFQQRFRYILVDEYQDTNVAQYLWLRLLAQRPEGERANICCVGDDDQSIYGWRGAEVANILRFDHDFPGAKVIRLERNYRSTGHILAAASCLIAQNESRLGKTLFPATDEMGAPVMVASGWDSSEEARSIGEDIERKQRQGISLNEIAILVRASFQMREFEDRFVTLGLPYRVIGGPRFFERMEIRDALAYLRVTQNPADGLAFERIVNTPKRGLGAATIQLIHSHARSRDIPLLAAAGELAATEEIKPRQRQALGDLVRNFARWSEMLEHTPHPELAEIILEESGYIEMWQRDRSPEAPGRLENLKELVNNLGEYDSLGGFLEHVSLVMDTEGGETEEAVSIMTLHSAKGLEFDVVYLPGWEEGLFPHQRALDESGKAGLEEERRLAYVGLTRARRHATIWFVGNRRVHGLWQSTLPSRFIDDLPEDHVEVAEPASYGGYGGAGHYGSGGYGGSRFERMEPFDSAYRTPGWQRAKSNRDRADPRNRTGRGPTTLEGELVAKSVIGGKSRYSVGERVFHQKFGYGTIHTIDGNKLTIDFEKSGRKRVVDSFVEAT
ncbi:UvrD-helicase domain-containing protein [Afifella sp. H1R]|uniref:ATP-dependent helicase n=1 Tax=Afifella sp. H1R TaxID=2908841 RepID=UPI001F3334B6|nr:UvrD-helicase domain-containing protein [Afifella sp. H1R]MCF1503427.1 UvrD-helicase domain-containing protein [Afifella sp. H1R]